MIIVTGAAGFIGSCLIAKLNELNFNYIIAVDDFTNEEKNKNSKFQQVIKQLEENYKTVVDDYNALLSKSEKMECKDHNEKQISGIFSK